jgi:hypothetical protein
MHGFQMDSRWIPYGSWVVDLGMDLTIDGKGVFIFIWSYSSRSGMDAKMDDGLIHPCLSTLGVETSISKSDRKIFWGQNWVTWLEVTLHLHKVYCGIELLNNIGLLSPWKTYPLVDLLIFSERNPESSQSNHVSQSHLFLVAGMRTVWSVMFV